MIVNLFIFAAAVYCIIKWALLSSKYAVLFAKSFHMSTYIVWLIVVSVISILPETFISVSSVFAWEPTLWLWTLFWSNVADLTLVFAIIALFSWRLNIKIKWSILANNRLYDLFLLVPIILWLDGSYTRFEWISLIIIWFLYYYNTLKGGKKEKTKEVKTINQSLIINNWLYLLWSITLLLIWAHFVVVSGIAIAEWFWVDPVIIGIWIVWLWTVIPELLFAFHAVKNYKDELAVWDLLWTVLADATVVIWIMATIMPFAFPEKIIYVTWIFMVGAGLLNGYCLRTWKILTKQEWVFLLLFWIIFVCTEYLVNS